MTYRRIPRGKTPPYPTDNELKAVVELYRTTVMNNTLVPDKFLKYQFNPYIEIFVCGGENNLFLAKAYPPAGFIIKNPEQVSGLKVSIARIFEYNRPKHTYKLAASTALQTRAEFGKLAKGLCPQYYPA